MEIHKRGTRVMVELDSEELEELGLSFEALREKGLAAGIFFAALKAQLIQSGFGNVRGDIRVSRRSGNVILTMTAYLAPEFFLSPAKVIERCLDADCEAELYKLDNEYVLIFPDCDPVETAKVREHGRLLSGNAVQMISALEGGRGNDGDDGDIPEL